MEVINDNIIVADDFNRVKLNKNNDFINASYITVSNFYQFTVFGQWTCIYFRVIKASKTATLHLKVNNIIPIVSR